jgi:hypothetical protein
MRIRFLLKKKLRIFLKANCREILNSEMWSSYSKYALNYKMK